MPATLSRRARFDIATIITAGLASTVFFLLPVWTSVVDSTASSNPAVPRLAAVQPAADATIDPSLSPRAEIRAVSAKRRGPVVVRARLEAKPARSRLARFLFGDGRNPVPPFPLARSERKSARPRAATVQGSRSATDGSRRDARRAGTTAATMTTNMTTRTPAPKLTASSGATP
jgi:hypothetical protein